MFATHSKAMQIHCQPQSLTDLKSEQARISTPTLVIIDITRCNNNEISELVNNQQSWLSNDKVQLALISKLQQNQGKEFFDFKDGLQTLNTPILFSNVVQRLANSEKPLNEVQSYTVFQGVKALLAEDFKLNQIVAKGLLEKLGIEVDIVEDGQQAVDAIGKNSYQLVFMDIHMPVMDGHLASQTIRANKAYDHIPIIALTADAQKQHIQQCIESGMDDFLSKPFLLADIEKIIHKHIQ